MTATAPMYTTRQIPLRTGEALPELLPARPEDADSLDAWVTFASLTVYPDRRPDFLVVTDPGRWVSGPSASGRPLQLLATHYPDGLPWDEYAQVMFWYPLEIAATVTAAVQLEGVESLGGFILMPRLEDGSHIRIQSLEPIVTPERDGTDLWEWAIAGRGGPGPASEKTRSRILPGAIATGQMMHDLASLYLPFAQETTGGPSSGIKPRRRNRWD